VKNSAWAITPKQENYNTNTHHKLEYSEPPRAVRTITKLSFSSKSVLNQSYVDKRKLNIYDFPEECHVNQF